MDNNLRLSISGLIVGIAGTVGTLFQIFGEQFLWIALALTGAFIFFFYLAREIREVTKVVATFGSRWRLIDGRLRIGNTINVALRAKTVQGLLEAFAPAYQDRSNYWKVVRDAGKSIGENFASDLRAELIQLGEDQIIRAGRTESLIKDKLKLWAKYDSSTGMGVFQVDAIHFANEVLQGTISVKNSFLTYDMHTPYPTCSFLEGYLEGIVLHLLDMRVTVNEIACSSSTGEGVCKFEITSSPVRGA